MSVYNGDGHLLPAAPGETIPMSVAYLGLSQSGLEQRLTDVVPAYTRFDLGAAWKHPDGRIGINAYDAPVQLPTLPAEAGRSR